MAFHKRPSKKTIEEFINGVPDSDIDNENEDEKVVYLSVDLSLLSSNPYNARFYYHQDDIDSLAANIDSDGQLVPIVITNNPEKEGHYIVIDGERRYRAHALLNKEKINAVFFENITGVDLYKYSLIINKQRSSQTLFDDARNIAKLIESNFFKSQQEAADVIQNNRTYVAKLLAIAEIPEQVARILTQSTLKNHLSMAYEFGLLCKLDLPVSDLIDLANQAVEEGLTVSKLVKLRENIAKQQAANAEQENKKRIAPTVFKFKDKSGKHSGRIRATGSKLTFDYAGPSRESVAELTKEIQALIERFTGGVDESTQGDDDAKE